METAALVLERLLGRVAVTVTPKLFREAVILQSRFCLSYWDAAILTGARLAGCKQVFSEDMGHLQIYGSVMVIGPFAMILSPFLPFEKEGIPVASRLLFPRIWTRRGRWWTLIGREKK